jgi:hypothetical protein
LVLLPAFYQEIAAHFFKDDWRHKSVIATAVPFNLSTSTRALTAEIAMFGGPPPNGDPGQDILVVTVKNVGPDAMRIWSVTLCVIEN